MFVSRSMTQKVISIDPDASAIEAKNLMSEHHIRHIPVVDPEKRLIGVVTDRDLRSVFPASFYKGEEQPGAVDEFKKLKIKDVMTRDPVSLTPYDTIQDALLLIQKMRVGALPVVDKEGKLTGIISVRDLLRAFINVLGIGTPGTLLCILVEEKVGQLKKIVDAITEENISFGSVLVARYWDKDKRAVFPYLLTQNVSKIKKKLENMGYTLLNPMDWYMDQLPKND
ncbi:MAG: CBS and ACT domain-containing protein [Desulfatirhabdiaceae bacterium]